MGNVAVTLAERPELEEQAIADGDIWPEFNLHGDTYLRMWPRLSKDLPEYQFSMCDDRTGQVIAEAHTVPCWWDGTPAGLPGGIDDTIADAFDRLDNDKPVNTLCAVAAEIPTGGRGTGLAAEILRAMGIIAARHGLTHMIAPVRPTWKDRYPITPIEQYMTWRREDGSLQDPWLRLHERLGATIGPAAPASYRIEATVAEWESWLAMALPETASIRSREASHRSQSIVRRTKPRTWNPMCG